MKLFRFQIMRALLLLCILSASQIGCSGGAGDSLAGGGIGGTGVTVASVGTTTGFGSVIVNGVTYDTSAAEIFIENTFAGAGDSVLAQYIALGMVVRVEGRLAPDGGAAADRIFYGSELKGPVESISDLDTLSKRLLILGQTVVMDDRTVLRNTDAASLSAGMVVEVSGLPDESGNFFATYINKTADALPPTGTAALKGTVQNLGPQTFRINLLTVDYATADLSALPVGAPQDGQLLKVRGRLQTARLLIADRLEPIEEFGTGAFDIVDFEGIITQALSPEEFRIGRYTVRADAGTLFRNLRPDDLKPGTRVIVEGSLANRSILSDEIRRPGSIRLESEVSSVSLAENSLVLVGLESVAVYATATTRFIGIAPALASINPGQHVRVLGRQAVAGGGIIASTILTTPFGNTVELAGPAESVLAPVIVILGSAVDTSSIGADRFRGPNGAPISPTEFFGILRPGAAVALAGSLQGGIANWESIALE
jgi:hypothetical protein